MTLFFPTAGLCYEIWNEHLPHNPLLPVLARAEVCELVKDGEPFNRAAVFSMEKGTVTCFTSFENIVSTQYIYHNWYFHDTLITKIKLEIRPPAWSTYSAIQLREADIGPWKVEIIGPEGEIFRQLRFSITD